jgi:FkbM family methyltransferase
MRFTVAGDDGTTIDFECVDTVVSRWVCGDILAGKTYPFLPFVDDVRIVFDVGANCGAASVHFGRHYPNAEVHSFEPGSTPRAFLERNATRYANVQVHPIGLHSVDQVVPLYKGDGDTGFGSVFRRSVNLEESEPVQLRAGGAWAAEHGIGRIDVLKVDVEGCEIDVLESLAGLLPTVKVLYVEYDSRQARRDIDRMLDETHEIYRGLLLLDQGECIYLRKDLAGLDAATECLRELLQAGWNDRPGRP